MIEIQDLTNKFKSDIIEMLLDQKKRPFEIYIPKSTQENFSEREAIATEYGYLTYAGQMLNGIAESFTYDEVSPADHESVLFETDTKDLDALAEVLFKISFGYVNDEDDEIYEEEGFEFEMWADQFLSDVESGKVVPACPYFYDQYQKFIEGNEND